jgi:hypothetical protein
MSNSELCSAVLISEMDVELVSDVWVIVWGVYRVDKNFYENFSYLVNILEK